MALNKKGMFFTVLVLVILTLFFIAYTLYSDIGKEKSGRKRVETLNNFLFSTEQDMSRQMYITGFRTIFLIEDHIVETGQYLSPLNPYFQEAFFNGTFSNQSEQLLIGATFSDMQTTISEKAQKINALVTLSNPLLTVSQEDPWNVKITLTTNLYMRDAANSDEGSWNKTEVTVTYIPVTRFEDPLYLVNTNGLMTNKISKTPFTTFVSGTNVTNLATHALGSYYTASTQAPSFLDRLQGISTASQNGIESLVNLNDLALKGISIKDKSVVDYIYFSNQNPTAYHIQGMLGWFKLDQPHLALYQAENITG